VYVSNDGRGAMENFDAEIALYNLKSEKIFSQSLKVNLAENLAKMICELPALKGDHEVYFLDLKLKNPAGEIVADNFYWLATSQDQMEWKRTVWFYTPQKEFADFRKIGLMTPVKPDISRIDANEGEEGTIAVSMNNSTKVISFFNEVVLEKKTSGQPVLPQFLNDNYISLLPGETKTVIVKYHLKDLAGDEPIVKIQGINLPGRIVL
jgi:exo-1,4-beta-D-glucosaminidase